MAGSYQHIVNKDGSFIGVELLDNLGDAWEALEECYDMIQYLTKGKDQRRKIYLSWLCGHLKRKCPENVSKQTMEEWWGDE